MSEGYHLYIVSFTAGREAGLAFVAAANDRDAFQILKNSGSRYGEGYSLIQCRDIGISTCCTYGLLLESFVNAREAYAEIIQVINRIAKGEKGDKGDKGEVGSKLFDFVEINVAGNTGTPSASSEIITDSSGNKVLVINLDGIKGEKGETGVSISGMTQTVESTEDSGRNEITVFFDNNTSTKFYVRNGSRGVNSASVTVDPLPGVPRAYTQIDENGELKLSFYGLKGAQGNPGANNTIMRIVSSLPESASAETADTIYLIYNSTSGEYDRYYTAFNGSTYSFVQMTSTAVDLSDYKRIDSEVWLTQEQFDAIAVKDSTKTYNIYEEEDETPIVIDSGSGSSGSSSDNGLSDTA